MRLDAIRRCSRLRRVQVGEQALYRLDVARPGELRSALCARAAHAIASYRVQEQLCNRVSHRLRIVGIDQQPGLAVRYGIQRAAYGTGNDRQPAGGSLEKHDSESLSGTVGEDEDVRAGKPFVTLFIRYLTKELHGIAEPVAVCRGLEHRAQRAVSYHDPLSVGDSRSNDRHRADDDVVSLLRVAKARDRDQRGSRGFLAVNRLDGIHPRMDAVDSYSVCSRFHGEPTAIPAHSNHRVSSSHRKRRDAGAIAELFGMDILQRGTVQQSAQCNGRGSSHDVSGNQQVGRPPDPLDQAASVEQQHRQPVALASPGRPLHLEGQPCVERGGARHRQCHDLHVDRPQPFYQALHYELDATRHRREVRRQQEGPRLAHGNQPSASASGHAR